MAVNVNDFLQLKPIIDQVQQSPTSKVKISKSQSRLLASMPEEQFGSFLELFRNPESSRMKKGANAGLAQGLQDNIKIIENTRAQRILARQSNPKFAQAAEIKQQKQVIGNYLESQKSAVDFLKGEGKPLNYVTSGSIKKATADFWDSK